MQPDETIQNYLEVLKIPFERLTHAPFYTVEETLGAYEAMGIPENKSLFLRDEKKRRFYLVVLEGHKRADLNTLAQKFGEKRLSFCSPATLEAILKTNPGAVSPLGLVFPESAEIEVLFDEDLLAGSHIGFHPNRNTQTWKMTTPDFAKFLQSLPQKVIIEVIV